MVILVIPGAECRNTRSERRLAVLEGIMRSLMPKVLLRILDIGRKKIVIRRG